jgi:integrase/recombinase XerD
MFEQLLSSATALRRHQDGPFAAERERYLQHCSDSGATYWSLRIKCNELLWAAKLLDVDAKNGVDMETLESIADRRIALVCLLSRRTVSDISRTSAVPA